MTKPLTQSRLLFKLKEFQAKYDVTGKALAAHINISVSVISSWRSGKKSPSLDRVNEILDAIVEIGDKERLALDPPKLSDLLEWRN